MNEFRIEISSVPDREKLVAEIWVAKKLIAEINQEKENTEIEFYLTEKTIFELKGFLEIIETAKKRLMET